MLSRQSVEGVIAKDNIHVLVRIKPPVESSDDDTGFCSVARDQNAVLVIQNQLYAFDKVIQSRYSDQSQLEVFDFIARPLLDNCLDGYNATIFAYGQTSSGKTYTMQGSDDNPGIIPLSLDYLFRRIQQQVQQLEQGESITWQVRCSFVEIYNEQVYDLLSDEQSQSLQIRQDLKRGVYVEGAIIELVQTAADALRIFDIGVSRRKIAATSLNRESSRSHVIFTVYVQSKVLVNGVYDVKVSKCHFTDLAGSERQGKADTSGQRLKEAGNINKSLLALGNVINALADNSLSTTTANATQNMIDNTSDGGLNCVRKSKFVQYRDSKLTFLLKDSLGGNALCRIVACVVGHDKELHLAETLSTLRFADRAKMIKSFATMNQEFVGDVTSLVDEISRLKHEVLMLKSHQIQQFGHSSLQQLVVQDSSLLESGNDVDRRDDQIAEWALNDQRQLRLEKEQLQQQLSQQEQLIESLDRKLQNEKMIVKLKDSVIGKLKSDQYSSVEIELIKEIDHLKQELQSNPAVIRFASDNLRLRQEVERYEQVMPEINRVEQLQFESKKIQYALSDRLLELERENKLMKQDAEQNLTQQHPELLEKLQSLIQKYHQVSEEKAVLQKEYDGLFDQLAVTKSEYSQLQKDALNSEQQWNERENQLKEDNEQLRIQAEKLVQQLTSLESNQLSRQSEYERQLSELQSQLSNSQDELSSKDQQVQQLKNELESVQRVMEQVQEKERYLDAAVEKLQIELESKDFEIDNLRQDLEIAVDGKTQIESQFSAQVEVLQHKYDEQLKLCVIQYKTQVDELQQQNRELHRHIELIKASSKDSDSKQLHKLQSELRLKEEALSLQGRELEQSAADCAQLRSQIVILNGSVSELQKQQSELRVSHQNELMQYKTKLDEMELMLQETIKKYDNQSAQLAEFGQLIDKANQLKAVPNGEQSLSDKLKQLLDHHSKLEEENDKLVKHNNVKQKLQYHLQIKQENNDLKVENMKLVQENDKLLRKIKELSL
ncbi:hypothetical protein MIR68_012638 [Amoeboaphelidium protococcarum]|nr:hypothetical protein MIR68_012638 [Amoeboaphelidium protococcarum]